MMDEFDLLFPRVEIAAAMEERVLLVHRELARPSRDLVMPTDPRAIDDGRAVVAPYSR